MESPTIKLEVTQEERQRRADQLRQDLSQLRAQQKAQEEAVAVPAPKPQLPSAPQRNRSDSEAAQALLRLQQQQLQEMRRRNAIQEMRAGQAARMELNKQITNQMLNSLPKPSTNPIPKISPITNPYEPLGSKNNPVYVQSDSKPNMVPYVTNPYDPVGTKYNPIYVETTQ